MPPQKSLIAELLRKQTKIEEAERESSVDPQAQESSYYNLDLHVGVSLKTLIHSITELNIIKTRRKTGP